VPKSSEQNTILLMKSSEQNYILLMIFFRLDQKMAPRSHGKVLLQGYEPSNVVAYGMLVMVIR
jgi:hypothetical protein